MHLRTLLNVRLGLVPYLQTIAKSVWLSYYTSSTGFILVACLDALVVATLSFLVVTGSVVCRNCDVTRSDLSEC